MGAIRPAGSATGRCAGLRDRQLLVGVAGLVATGHEPEVGADVAGVGEALRIFEREHEGERGERTDAGDLAQPGGGGIAFEGSKASSSASSCLTWALSASIAASSGSINAASAGASWARTLRVRKPWP